MNSIRSVDWIIRCATPVWLSAAGIEYTPIQTQLLDPEELTRPLLDALNEAGTAAAKNWSEGFPNAGLICRDVARAASSVAVYHSGWPRAARAAWQHPWDGQSLEALTEAWNACKAAVRMATWIIGRDASAPLANRFTGHNDEGWRSSYAAAFAALEPIAMELRTSF